MALCIQRKPGQAFDLTAGRSKRRVTVYSTSPERLTLCDGARIVPPAVVTVGGHRVLISMDGDLVHITAPKAVAILRDNAKRREP